MDSSLFSCVFVGSLVHGAQHCSQNYVPGMSPPPSLFVPRFEEPDDLFEPFVRTTVKCVSFVVVVVGVRRLNGN